MNANEFSKFLDDVYTYDKEIIKTSKVNLDPEFEEIIKTHFRLSPKKVLLFYHIIDKLGYNKPAQVVNGMQSMKIKSCKFYRGAIKLDYLLQGLLAPDYHKGVGIYGSGLYANRGKKIAKFYGKGDEGAVCSFKLSRDTRILTQKHKKELRDKIRVRYFNATPKSKMQHNKELDIFFDYLSKTSEDKRRFWLNLCIIDFNQVAAILGYEAVESNKSPKDIIILNRGKMIVKDKTIKGLLKTSKCYKYSEAGGIYLANNKAENEKTL